MLNDFIKYLKENIPSHLQTTENYLCGKLHSITIYFDSIMALGQFTVWSDLKSTCEFIKYETGEQISWDCSFNKTTDELINQLNIFIEKTKEYFDYSKQV